MKKRILTFVIGLVAGVIIGVVFDVGIKAIFNQVRALRFSLNKINSQQDKLSQRLDSIQGTLKDDKKNVPVANKGVAKPQTIAPSSIVKHDSLAGIKGDSAGGEHDSSVVTGVVDSNVVIMTNQLVSVVTLPLKNIDSTSVDKSTEKSDSMIASMSQVSEEKEPSAYRIEFWESPLNFKGYKMSRGKIVLYGVNSNTPLRLVKCDDGYYLLSTQWVYKVNYTDDYRPFEKVNDKNVLKKLTL
jgi:hypothetical protein